MLKIKRYFNYMGIVFTSDSWIM